MKKRLISGTALGFLITLGFMLGFAGPAQAASYDCDGGANPVPASPPGDVTINAAGACTVSHGIDAGGFIDIQAGGPITISGNLISGTYVKIVANTSSASNSISVVDITTAAKTVFLAAGGNVKTGNISTGSPTGAAAVSINANVAGTGNTQFVTGASSSNGTGTIQAISTGGNPVAPPFVYIANGGTGGIKLTSSTDIDVSVATAQAGAIILYAPNGTVTLPSGTISVDGSSNGANAAGAIWISATTVIGNGTTLSANDNGSGLAHSVHIAATTINTSNGLTIRADGIGPNNNLLNSNNALFMPKGGMVFSAFFSPPGANTVSTTLVSTQGALTFSGSGPLDIHSNGTSTAIEFTGYPETFSVSGQTTISAKGSSTNILFTYFGTASGATGLNFAGGPVTISADGTNNSNGGTVKIQADNVAIPANKVTITSNGAGTGNGGSIIFQITHTGNGVRIGTDVGDFNLAATGGSSGSASGNGGTVSLTGDGSTAYTFDNLSAFPGVGVNVSAIGTNGAGGTITAKSGAIATFSNGNGPVTLTADGKGSPGKGGTISLEVLNTTGVPLKIGNDVASFILSAKSLGSSDGGTISLKSATEVIVDAAQLTAAAGTSGNGIGGNITIQSNLVPTVHTDPTVSISGELNTNGRGTGRGGNITITGFGVALTNVSLTANGGATGDGGTITVTSIAADQTLLVYAGQQIQANGGVTSGKGGTITFNAGGTMTVQSTATVSASAQGTGDGGSITATAFANLTIDSTALAVTAGTNGNGGNITLTGNTLINTAPTGLVSANGQGTGNGGTISLNAPGSALTIGPGQFIISAQSLGSGNGGTVTLNGPGAVSINTMNGISPSINVSGGTNGNGGKINVSATNGPIAVVGTLAANGQGSGKGGNIVLSGQTLTLTAAQFQANGGLTGAGGRVHLEDTGASTTSGITVGGTGGTSVAATGGTTSGNGGTAELVSANGNIAITSSQATPALNVSAGPSGNGAGGSISVNSTQITLTGTLDVTGKGAGKGGNVDLVVTGATPIDLSQAIINANADPNGSGLGGMVSVNKAKGAGTNAIDVNAIIKVDGAGTGANTQDGSIALNGVTCQQYPVGAGASWPTTSWDCTGNSPPNQTGAAFAQTLPGSLKTTLSNNKVQIYLLTNVANYESFFSTTIESNNAGYTQQIVSGSVIYSAVILNVQPTNGSGFTQSTTEIDETTAHELGHALNIINGNQGANAFYNTFVQNDFLYLDYSIVAASQPRDPCVASIVNGVSVPAPFAGVIDNSGATSVPFCTNGTIESKYAGMSNSAIIQAAEPVMDSYGPDVWRELYAQSFAYTAYVSTSGLSPSQTLHSIANGVIQNSYFECTQAWATNLFDSKVVPPSPSPSPGVGSTQSCSSALPSWYTPRT